MMCIGSWVLELPVFFCILGEAPQYAAARKGKE